MVLLISHAFHNTHCMCVAEVIKCVMSIAVLANILFKCILSTKWILFCVGVTHLMYVMGLLKESNTSLRCVTYDVTEKCVIKTHFY